MNSKIKYLIGVFALFFIAYEVKTQELLPEFYDSIPTKKQITIKGNVFQHSSSVFNELTRKFVLGGEIDKGIISRGFSEQNDINRLGGGYHSRIEYKHDKKLSERYANWSWMIHAGMEAHFTAQYSKDAFGLLFLGNYPFLGSKMDLGNTKIRYEQFLSIGGGFHHKISKSYWTLNAILPQHFFEFESIRANLEFGQTGEDVFADIDANWQNTNSSTYFKGMGLAFNGDWNLPFGEDEAFTGIVTIAVRNLGVYYLHEMAKTNLQTKQYFDGFSLDEIIENKAQDIVGDSLNRSDVTEGSFKLLPGFIQIGKVVTKDELKKLQSFFGIRMYTNKLYKPLIYVGGHHQLFPSFSYGVQGTFGGYGAFRLGMYAQYDKGKLNIGIGTEDVLGISKKQKGHAAIIRLGWKL